MLPFIFKYNFFRHLMGKHRQLFLENGVTTLYLLQEILDGNKELRPENASKAQQAVTFARVKWSAAQEEIEENCKVYGYRSAALSLQQLHGSICRIKAKRDVLGHPVQNTPDSDQVRELTSKVLDHEDFKPFPSCLERMDQRQK
ncbi:hypothetical protein BDK51DRAFT_35070 [Blyttiomyces helicus]|uniref:Uncharacterized protein n=1 Tax=Blyttiomyces helicus TaxID=388810 RepID=A0A4P9WQ82_9FUNG|nr:hypothetical protein BDK51DRAFT_35070 [Blyttiomyces helicus]|eukprot:RKO94752.1 hypothetical protein BDK51DRAFT_35070 [Blyttiomyces helicus]